MPVVEILAAKAPETLRSRRALPDCASTLCLAPASGAYEWQPGREFPASSFPHLSVTGRTARELLDVVFLHKLKTQRQLIRRRLPVHVKDLLPRPYETFGRAVAFQAPLHRYGVRAPGARHLINSPMTRV